MYEAIWGIVSIIATIIVAILFYIIGKRSGESQKRELIDKIKILENQNNEQKDMLEKSIQAVGTLHAELKEIRFRKAEGPMIPKKESEVENAIKDLAIFGLKQWGKKKINEWLYPDEDDEEN
jgi:hypothetical protein